MIEHNEIKNRQKERTITILISKTLKKKMHSLSYI